MRKIFALSFFLFIASGALCLSFYYPWIPENGNALKDFVPVDWDILQQAKGDMNGDSLQDMAAIIQLKYPVNESFKTDSGNSPLHARPRILLVIFSTRANGWKYNLALQNNSFVLREGESGDNTDPLKKLEISDQMLIMQFGGGSITHWDLTYGFKYKRRQWQLSRAEKELQHPTLGYTESWNFDFVSKKFCYHYSSATIAEKAEKLKDCKRLKIKSYKTIEDFSRPWSWEILPGIVL